MTQAERVFERLLANGYFPRELPPTFVTKSLGGNLTSDSDLVKQSRSAGIIRHNLARSGLLRRELGIPNPSAFAVLCRELAEAWPNLEKDLKRSPWSKSRAVFHGKGARAFLPLVSRQSGLIRPRATVRAGARLIVSTDISRFYHSIYTHSVPW